MASKTSHIQVAASEGMRAGFRTYQRRLRTSGLEAVQAKADEFVGNKGFKLYCSTFGADVDAAKGVATAPTRTRLFTRSSRTTPAPVVATEDDGSIEWLKAEIARREAAQAQSTKPAQASTKENLWRPWAVRKYGIPTKVGGTFVYTSKKRKSSSTHKVVRVTDDGCYTIKVA